MRWKTVSPVVAVVLGIAVLVACGPANAAAISWGDVFEVVSDADIDTSGTVVSAINGAKVGELDIVVTVGSTPITFVSPDPPIFASAHKFGALPDIAPTGNTDLDEVFLSHTWEGGDHSVDTVPFTVTGLTPGQAYQIQIIAAPDGRSCCATRTQIFQDMADGSGSNSDPLIRATDLGGTGALHPNSVIGTFTADAAELTIWANGVKDPGIGGYIVSAVPEPSSLVILVLCGLGLLVPARKRA